MLQVKASVVQVHWVSKSYFLIVPWKNKKNIERGHLWAPPRLRPSKGPISTRRIIDRKCCINARKWDAAPAGLLFKCFSFYEAAGRVAPLENQSTVSKSVDNLENGSARKAEWYLVGKYEKTRENSCGT